MVEQESASVALRDQVIQEGGPSLANVTVRVHRDHKRHWRRCTPEGVEQIVLEHTIIRPKAVTHHIGEACLRSFQPLAFVKNLDVTIHARLVL